MKYFLLIAFACILIIACNKTVSSTLMGRWKVVIDSSIISGGAISYNIYNENDNDYFDFTSNGLLYTKEGLVNDTFSYKLTSGNTINLIETGVLINGIPQSGAYRITDNKARIFVVPDFSNPGFSYQRIINLKR